MSRTLRPRSGRVGIFSKVSFEALEPRVLFSSTDDALVIMQEPGFVVSGQNIGATGQAFEVAVLKNGGGIDTSYNGNVTISLAGNVVVNYPEQPYVTIGLGPVAETVQAVNGVATFSNMILPGAGWYNIDLTDDQGDPTFPDGGTAGADGILQAWAPGSTPVTGIQNQLSFVRAPTSAPDGTFSVTLQMLDWQGNPAAPGTTVSLEILSGPTGASLDSSNGYLQPYGAQNPLAPGAEGNIILADVGADGMVTFSGLSLNAAGTYTLIAESRNYFGIGAISGSFTWSGITPVANPTSPGSPSSSSVAASFASPAVKLVAAPVAGGLISPFTAPSSAATGTESQLLGTASDTLNIAATPPLLD